MSRLLQRLLVLAGVWGTACGAHAIETQTESPVPGQDYYSWQIISGSPKSLEKIYRHYSELPYVRIERRGDLYVLRAGFWPSSQAARAALAQRLGKDALIRIAAYRPDAIVRRNWETTPEVKATDSLTQDMPLRPVKPAPASLTSMVTDSPARVQTKTQSMPVREAGDLKPFDAADYALAFNVFMGAGQTEQAFRLAQKAVASVPMDTDWRRKLARLCDWTKRPQLAWTHWSHLFQQGDHSDEVVNAVLRLAPMTEQPELAIAAWDVRAARQEPTPAQWTDLYRLFDMAGQSGQGSVYFERQYRSKADPKFLEQAAQMAVNAGDDERGLRLYTERAKLQPFSMDATLHAVVTLIRRDRMREAYVLMQAVSPEVRADAEEFWRLLGNVAWELQEAAGAEKAYQNFVHRPEATAGDWSRLIYLVRQRHPKQGADLALEAYRRYGNTDNLMLALGIYAQAGDVAGQARVFKQLSPADLVLLEADVQFLVIRGRFYQSQGELDKAWADLRRALNHSPEDSEIAVPALWFLIDTGRKQELERMLRTLAPLAQKESAYWMPLAAGYHALDRYKEALDWYRKEVLRIPDDNLLLLNYADALARVNLVGMAERVRRHAWFKLQEKYPKPSIQAPLDDQPELLALARLAILNTPGDPGLALMRQVVSQLRGLSEEPTKTKQTRDLILGWAISKEQFQNARSWMWLNYARQANEDQSAPLWGESQTALQLSETQTMDQLLLQQADRLPVYNRYDTAYALEHWPKALNVAYEGMLRNEVDEPLHDRYRQHTPLHAHYVQMRAATEDYGSLNVNSLQMEAHLVLEPKWHLILGWAQNTQSSSDLGTAPFVPGGEQLSSLGLRWLGGQGDTAASLFQRNEMAGNLGLKLSQIWRTSQRLIFDGSAGLRVDSTDSLPLRVGGYEDNVRMGFNYVISKREYLRYGLRLARFSTQFGDYLGSGQNHSLELGYRIRTEYPDFRVRVFAEQYNYNYDGSVGPQALNRLSPDVLGQISTGNLEAVKYFLPQGSTSLGACLGMGENLAGQNIQDIYTRALRPFFDVCTTNNSLNGAGYSGTLGLAGAITGEDHFSIRMEQSSGGTGSGALSKIWALRYRHYF
jgi:polysaccharide biosynthesis protein PelB